MNKKALAITLTILVAIGAGTAYLLARPQEQQASQQSANESSGENSEPGVTNKGAYIDYEDGIVAKTAGTKLLFFHAPWCPQCRDLESDIKQQGVPAGVTIIKVDYDSNQDLRKKYGVTLQTTFVRVNDNGELEKKFTAYDDPVLSSVTKNLL